MKVKFLLLLLLFPVLAFSQIRIDWQQCYGSLETDNALGIIQNDSGGFYVVGHVGEQSGMVSCSLGATGYCWLIEIDDIGELVGEECIIGFATNFQGLMNGKDDSFYLVGLGINQFHNGMIEMRKYGYNGDVIWTTQAGNPLKSFITTGHNATTPDGGVVVTHYTQWPCGPGGEYYGMDDAWVVKINSEGEQEWETTLGSEGEELPSALFCDSNGNSLVSISGFPFGQGNIASCNRPLYDAIITKLDTNGEIVWSRCYGGNEADGFYCINELPDGYLLAGDTRSDDVDLEGAGYHLGYQNGNQWEGRTDDVWLMRTDFDGNVLWSRCYGGTGNDRPTKIFQNEDGGFTVFGRSNSIDGDVQSGQNVHFPWDEYPEDRIWMFKTDGDGNLIWERAIGHFASRITLSDVIKHNDSEYTLAATSASPTDPMYQGDYNCSNSNLCHYMNYWVLHITDIFDYDGVEEGQIEARNMSVYLNPAQGMLTVSGKDIRKVCLYDLLGQQVATAPSYNGSNVMLSTSGLAAGIYMVQVRTENGTCVKRVVVSE